MGTGEPILYQTPQKLPNLKVKDVAANIKGSYFVDLNGSLWSVGYEDYGELGNGSAGHSSVPLKIVDGNVSSVETNSYHVLYRDVNGSLLGFGRGLYGALSVKLFPYSKVQLWFKMEM